MEAGGWKDTRQSGVACAVSPQMSACCEKGPQGLRASWLSCPPTPAGCGQKLCKVLASLVSGRGPHPQHQLPTEGAHPSTSHRVLSVTSMSR